MDEEEFKFSIMCSVHYCGVRAADDDMNLIFTDNGDGTYTVDESNLYCLTEGWTHLFYISKIAWTAGE